MLIVLLIERLFIGCLFILPILKCQLIVHFMNVSGKKCAFIEGCLDFLLSAR